MELFNFTWCRLGLIFGKGNLQIGKLKKLKNLEFSKKSQEGIALTAKETHQEFSLENCVLPTKTIWKMSKGATLRKLQLQRN